MAAEIEDEAVLFLRPSSLLKTDLVLVLQWVGRGTCIHGSVCGICGVCVCQHPFEQEIVWKNVFKRFKTNGNEHLIKLSNKELMLITLATFLSKFDSHIITTRISKNGYFESPAIAAFPWQHSKEREFCLDNLCRADDTCYKCLFPGQRK